MKIIYLLLIPLATISCGDGESEVLMSQSVSEVQTEDESDDCYDPDDSDCPCYVVDTEVADEGVQFWESAWFQYYQKQGEELSETANQLVFSSENVNALINMSYPDGIRIYYGLEDGGTIPILLMVPVDQSCSDMQTAYADSNVLVRTPTEEYFCSVEEGEVLTENWKTLSSENEDVLTGVNAYTYSRIDIMNLVEVDGDYNTGLLVEFGLRTLAPQEVCFPVPENNAYGTIIYCNLISSENPDPGRDLGRLDFAMPCPKVCDCNSEMF